MMKTKPSKPYKDFPLTAHVNGQWCKKIRGRLHYFGAWDDWQAALRLYLEQRDDLQAGRNPKAVHGELTWGYALDHFLSSKKLALQSGDIGLRSYNEYEATCDKIALTIKPERAYSSIDVRDLQTLRADLCEGRSPVTAKGDINRARMVFLYANEFLSEKGVRYRKILKLPSRKLLREVVNKRGPRMFTREQIHAAINEAGPQLKAMIYLGINCGFGNHDCGTLPIDKVDLKGGWHHYWRPKTQNPRRCPLWPETVTAIKEALKDRPKPKVPEANELLFVTKPGGVWADLKGDRNNPLSSEFRKLLQSVGVYRKGVTTFYSLRRTFETIGATAGEQIAVDFIMGHVAPADDMAAVYRQKTFDTPLVKVTNHVRAWLLGDVKIE